MALRLHTLAACAVKAERRLEPGFVKQFHIQAKFYFGNATPATRE